MTKFIYLTDSSKEWSINPKELSAFGYEDEGEDYISTLSLLFTSGERIQLVGTDDYHRGPNEFPKGDLHTFYQQIKQALEN